MDKERIFRKLFQVKVYFVVKIITMAVSENYLEFIKEQLTEFSEVHIKKMFGGIGLFRDGMMFGKIGNDTLWLKVDEHNQADYEAKGMKAFYSEKKKKGMPYWEVPAEVIEDKALMKEWAMKAFEAAQRAKK